ncbi:MAG: hypothetical protein OEU68_18150 [Nitrospira sp.]|nr:hypothetical protein [Nitrospira sp.]MDH4244994.1 hypothetical protein [Nitrospira sp.]MDH4356567.1 hypothetical protein [Nitrospira sp.]MDH5319952.1 hypothetical protein [Nitrospira sp.]
MGTRYVRLVHLTGLRIVGVALCLLLVMMMGGPVLAHEMPGASPLSPEELQKVSPEDIQKASPEEIQKAGPSRAKEAGLQAASWLLTLPYGAAKVAYAVGGGVVGGLAWVMTGGKTEVAKSVWIPSMTGDYIVQPQHLTREKPLRFMGVPSGEPSF